MRVYRETSVLALNAPLEFLIPALELACHACLTQLLHAIVIFGSPSLRVLWSVGKSRCLAKLLGQPLFHKYLHD